MKGTQLEIKEFKGNKVYTPLTMMSKSYFILNNLKEKLPGLYKYIMNIKKEKKNELSKRH